MDQVRQVLRYHHCAYPTERTYFDWILRYIKFHGDESCPVHIAKRLIAAFRSHLAGEGRISVSAQRLALNVVVQSSLTALCETPHRFASA